MLKGYLQIIKPGIILGNLISVAGGFMLASKGNINYSLFFWTLSSVSLVVASGCIYNNFIDRDIDKKMERTKNRVLVKELISPALSIIYATTLGIIGLGILYFKTNLLAMWLSIIGFIVYVGIYSLYMKRSSIYSTLVGSFSGAIPPVIGYCSIINQLDNGALILFIIFSLWQIPHSYAIVIFRFQDYNAAHIPALPIVSGIPIAKNHIIFYIIAFMIATLMLTAFGYTGYKYFIVSILICSVWLIIALSGYKTKNSRIWARTIFIFSIIVITTLSLMMSIDFIA